MKIAELIMIVAGGLWVGAALAILVDRVPAWGEMSDEEFVVDFRRVLHNMDPMQPALAVITTVAAIVFVLLADDASGALAWASIGIYVLIILAPLIAYPFRSRFTFYPDMIALVGKEDADAAAIDVDSMRRLWGRLHLWRTVLGIAAFVGLAIVAVDL